MKNKKVYLRIIETDSYSRNIFDIFEGDIKKDKKYLKEYHNSKARYFEIKEIKIK